MTVYYVTSDSPGGRAGTSVAESWTLAEAEANATAGDEVRLCGTPFNLTGANTWAWNNTSPLGTGANPIKIRGYSADGTTPAAVTISGAGMNASTDVMSISVGTNLILYDIRITAARQYGLALGGAAMLHLHRCRIDSCLSHGFYSTATLSMVSMNGCEIDHNLGNGYSVNSSYRGKLTAYRTSFHHNTGMGAYDSGTDDASQTKPQYRQCRFFRNGSDGLKIYNATMGYVLVDACTFFANVGDGFDVPATFGQINVQNSIFSENGGYGINTNTGSVGAFSLIENNCSYGNASGHIDINSGTLPGTGHILEDPVFVVESDGSEDLTPTNANLRKSLTMAGGTTYFWPGAIQPALTIYSSSGGGTTASEVANAVLEESVGDHSGVSGSLAAAIAAIPTAAQNLAAIVASSTPIPANVLTFNGGSVTPISDIPTASAVADLHTDVGTVLANLATVDTVVDTLTTNLATVDTNIDSIGTALATVDTNVDSILAAQANQATSSALATVDTNVDSLVTSLATVDTNVDSILAAQANQATSAALATVDTNVDSLVTSLATVDTNVDSILAAQSNQATSSALATVDTNVDSILAGQITVDTNVDGVKAVTDQLGNMIDTGAFKSTVYANMPASGGSTSPTAVITTIGPVKDAFGGLLVGADIILTNDNIGQSYAYGGSAGDNGCLIVPMEPGTYYAWVSKYGKLVSGPHTVTVVAPVVE